MTTLLAVEGLTKSFGGIRALDECSFEIAEGSVGALIGPNGSGKTTAFNMITGYQPADAGRLTFRGHPVRHPDPCRLQRLGLARTFQQARIFSGLSVLENVVLGRNQSWRALLGRRVSGPERRRAEEELATVQRQIETQAAVAGSSGELRRLLERKQELRRRLDPPA